MKFLLEYEYIENVIIYTQYIHYVMLSQEILLLALKKSVSHKTRKPKRNE